MERHFEFMELHSAPLSAAITGKIYKKKKFPKGNES